MTTLKDFGLDPHDKPTLSDVTRGEARVLTTKPTFREAMDYALEYYHRTGVEPTVVKKSENAQMVIVFGRPKKGVSE